MKEDVIFAIQKFVVLLYNYKLSWLGTHAHFLWYLNIGGRSFLSCGVGDGASVPSYLKWIGSGKFGGQVTASGF